MDSRTRCAWASRNGGHRFDQAHQAIQSAQPVERHVAHHDDSRAAHLLAVSRFRQASIPCAISRRRMREPGGTAQLARSGNLARKDLRFGTRPAPRIVRDGAALGFYLAEIDGADACIHAVDEQVAGFERTAARKNCQVGAIPVQDYREVDGPFDSIGIGRHVRTCRTSILRDLFQALRRNSDRRRPS